MHYCVVVKQDLSYWLMVQEETCTALWQLPLHVALCVWLLGLCMLVGVTQCLVLSAKVAGTVANMLYLCLLQSSLI